jgi:hypothetical protein
MALPLEVGGQKAWAHDEGLSTGTFHTFDALRLGWLPPRKVHVFLPREAHDPRRRFPVVVMHDGDTSFWPGGIAHSTWDTATALASPGPDGKRPAPAIVVAVHPHDRNEEYTHVDWSLGRRPWGKLPVYAAHIARELVPFLDAHYPTLTEPKHRAVVGSSHGGLASFYIATRHPDVFGFGGCMSPSFFSGIEPPPFGPGAAPLPEASIVKDALDVLKDPRRRPRLWMCWGLRRDGGEHNSVVEHLATERGLEMARLLAQLGYRHHDVAPGELPKSDAELWSHTDPHGAHDEPSWGRRLPLLLRAFAG